MPRFRPLILALAMLPTLAGCGQGVEEKPPLSAEAMAAVKADPGAPPRQLAREVDDLFSDPTLGETRAVIVMHGGRVVAERHAPGYGPETRHLGWSMSKTVTATIIGMLVADGRLRLDQSAPVPRWQRPGDPRGEITLRQLLQMRSGLRHTESGDPPYESSEVRMLFLDGRDDMADWAESQPLESEPGQTFKYSTATTVILSDIIARALTASNSPEIRRRAVNDYLRARLFAPLGLDSMVAEYDASGTLIGGSMMQGTARDWARFGEFLRTKGSYRGSQLIPRKWIEFMTTPSPRSPHYGAQTWLNRPSDADPPPLFPGRASNRIFAAIGHRGQYLLVAPDRGLTIVRLGDSTAEERRQLLPQLADLVELYPAR